MLSGGVGKMVQEIQHRVLTVMSEMLHVREIEISVEASLRDDLQMDSLKMMTLMILLEDEFQQTIPPEEVTGLQTVNDVVGFIEKKISETPPP